MKWHKRFLSLAAHVAKWSKDPSTQCGAVIVRPDRTIASLGFNGYPRGVKDEFLADREHKLERMVHAEMNALLFAREPLQEGYTLYTFPFGPCARCAVHVIQAGVRRVVAPVDVPGRWQESLEITRQLFADAKVQFHEVSQPELERMDEEEFRKVGGGAAGPGGIGGSGGADIWIRCRADSHGGGGGGQ